VKTKLNLFCEGVWDGFSRLGKPKHCKNIQQSYVKELSVKIT
jgi:hypothetical protein